MSDDSQILNKKNALPDRSSSSDYAPTEELNLKDFEDLAKNVLRQRKISAVVANHLTPQFDEFGKQEKNNKERNARKSSNKDGDEGEEQKKGSIYVSIDADVFDSVLIGLSQMVERQRRFANEYNLKISDVFDSDIKEIQRRGSASVLNEWLRSGKENSSSKLDALLEDLTMHHENLLESFDTVTRRTIKYLGPELTKKSAQGLGKLGFLWPHYKKRNRKLLTDKKTRSKLLIVPGIAYGYVKAKAKTIKKKINKL